MFAEWDRATRTRPSMPRCHSRAPLPDARGTLCTRTHGTDRSADDLFDPPNTLGRLRPREPRRRSMVDRGLGRRGPIHPTGLAHRGETRSPSMFSWLPRLPGSPRVLSTGTGVERRDQPEPATSRGLSEPCPRRPSSDDRFRPCTRRCPSTWPRGRIRSCAAWSDAHACGPSCCEGPAQKCA